MTVVLSIATCVYILPPMINFPGKTDHTIKDLIVSDNLCIVTQEKAWIDEFLFDDGRI